MKKFERLGKVLSKQEQKNVFGGKAEYSCTCTGSSCSNSGYTFYCNSEDGGLYNCASLALNRYCTGSGCGGSCGATSID